MGGELREFPSWVKRMETYFNYIDRNKDGVITIFDIQQWATHIESKCNPTPIEMVTLRAQLYHYWGQIGLGLNVSMTKNDFIKNVSRFGHEEMRRAEKNEDTFLKQVSYAYFNIFDLNKDGLVTLEELRTVIPKTGNLDMARTWLEAVGSKRDDKSIDKYELYHSEYNFWFNPYGKCVLCRCSGCNNG